MMNQFLQFDVKLIEFFPFMFIVIYKIYNNFLHT